MLNRTIPALLLAASFIFLSTPSLPQNNENVAAIEIRGLKTVDEQKVRSVLKTQVDKPLDENLIRDDIKSIYELGFFSEDIQALHNTGDCYVSAHHGEGWGVPIHDAMHAENHIITTKFGGVTEHLDNSTANIIEHKIGPVSGMDWSPLYGNYQNWAYPSIRSLSQEMRRIYQNSDVYAEKTIKAKQLAEQMSIESIAKLINKELSTPR